MVTAGPTGREPGGLPGDAGCQAWHPLPCLKAADGDYLVPRPDSNGEGAGAAAQDCVGGVVERLKGWNQAASTDPDKGGGEQLGWQLAGQVVLELCPGKEGAETCKVLEKVGKVQRFVGHSSHKE